MKTINNKQPHSQQFFNNIAKDFDNHVRQSIPLYGEFIGYLTRSLARNYKHAGIIDLCGSTGLFGQLLSDRGFKGEYLNIDGSPEMINIANNINEHPDTHKNVLGGFLATWKDEQTGVTVPEIDTTPLAADVILELLGFQFFTEHRRRPAAVMKESTRYSSGLCIFCEKFKQSDPQSFQANELLKDVFHKSAFFTPEQLEKKRTDVLTPMNNYLYPQKDFEKVLTDTFKAYRKIYQAGNFAAYIASDDAEKVANFPKTPKELLSNIFTNTKTL